MNRFQVSHTSNVLYELNTFSSDTCDEFKM